MMDMIKRQLNDVHSLCSWVVGVFTCGPSRWEALHSDLVTLAYYRHTRGGEFTHPLLLRVETSLHSYFHVVFTFTVPPVSV